MPGRLFYCYPKPNAPIPHPSQILNYHVVAGQALISTQLFSGQSLSTLDSGESITVRTAKMLPGDAPRRNGTPQLQFILDFLPLQVNIQSGEGIFLVPTGANVAPTVAPTALIVTPDVPAGNAVIHIINRVRGG
jgi:Fasciclin domain